MNRLNWSEVAPAGAKALYGVHHYVTTSTALPEELIHLVFLRVSQINGCAHCIDLHTRDLLKTMPIDKIALLPVWHEVPHLFPDQYRAALAWAIGSAGAVFQNLKFFSSSRMDGMAIVFTLLGCRG